MRSGVRTVLTIFLIVAFVGTLLAAVLVRDWRLLPIAAFLFVVYMFVLLTPVWLAAASRTMEDETIREQR